MMKANLQSPVQDHAELLQGKATEHGWQSAGERKGGGRAATASWSAAVLCRFLKAGFRSKAPGDWRTPKPGGDSTALTAKPGFPSTSSERGVALVITLILLSIITFMAIAFLVISRHASEAVTSVTQQAIATQAANSAVQQAEARIVATMIAQNNGFNFGPQVSQNYQSPNFTNGSTNVANVNYFAAVDNTGNPVTYTSANYLQMLNNLLVLPRPPVFIVTNPSPLFAPEFRFFLDLNRNGIYDPASFSTYDAASGTNGNQLIVTNQFNQAEPIAAGDPEWIGILEHPDQPHSRSNFFTARYAYFAQPIGNSLDINYIHNHAKDNGAYQNDGFLRNEGVGSWEINLAGFLNGLNPNLWGYDYEPYDSLGVQTLASSTGSAFQDAASLLQYRDGGSYQQVPTFANLYPQFTQLFYFEGIDGYTAGPLMTGLFLSNVLDRSALPWSGSGNFNNFFTTQDFFTAPNNSAIVAANTFVANLNKAGQGLPLPTAPATFPNADFNRYTYYRMLSQMGMESAPDPATKLNLNYKNVDGNSASNFTSWSEIANPATGTGTWNNGVEFFTHAADMLLKSQPGLVANCPTISITNIPIYPINYYTPSVNRMLQLAANIYDAANPKIINDTNTQFDYPSVFSPVFGASTSQNPANGRIQTNIWIKGYVEETNNRDYATNAYFSLSAPLDIFKMWSLGIRNVPTNYNIYNIPWIIGAKKGLPNFNQISLESFTQLTRKLQITKPTAASDRATWHTNVQYILSVSNGLFGETWNSYISNYSRAVDISGLDTLNMVLANENGVVSPTITYNTNVALPLTLPTVPAGTWPGIGLNLASNIAGSFRIPLLTTVNFLPGGIYSTNTVGTGTFIIVPNPVTSGFEKTTGYPLPRFGLSLSNRFVLTMVDTATGRVIDHVQLEGMGGQRELTGGGELMGGDDWGPGGVWDTNRYPTLSINPMNQMSGIENQITASQQPPPYTAPGYVTPVTDADWNKAVTQSMGFSSVSAAAIAFNNFFNGTNGPTFMQVPFTPTRSVCVYYTWQANDPLVHYTLPDLTDLISSSNGIQTNWTLTNIILGNLGQINKRYNPWGGSINGGNADYNSNMTLMDPLVTRSDDWQFPEGKLPNIGWLGRVHRGTPWQTVYMKSSPVDPVLWQKWTGNTNIMLGTNAMFDSFISSPINDWSIFDFFTTAPNDNASRGQLSVNQTNYAAWAALLDGVIVLSNNAASNALTPVVIDPNATNGAVFSIFDSIRQTRTNINRYGGVQGIQGIVTTGNVFTRMGDILAAPALTTTSPFLNFNDPSAATQLNDAAVERLPQQIMSLLRVGRPRYVIYAYGQSLKPADHSVVSGGPFYGTCTNYQITGEVVTRTVVRFEPATPLSPTNVYTAMDPTQNPLMPAGMFPTYTNYNTRPLTLGLPSPLPPMRAVIESSTVLPPE
jgi:hypothetical protein